jgi:lysozyme family protein
MKQVIQLDAAGYFVGFATADESPLEPGVFLIPGGCIEATTPTVPEGQRAKWDGAWVFEDVPQPEPEPEPTPPTPEEQAEALRVLRQQAYQKEADPLFFKAQRGEIEPQEWLDKVADIKARYPKV